MPGAKSHNGKGGDKELEDLITLLRAYHRGIKVLSDEELLATKAKVERLAKRLGVNIQVIIDVIQHR